MTLEFTALQVRALKGCPISIIMLFLIERRQLSQEYLRRYTGYSDEAVHDAVDVLAEFGILQAAGRYEWALADGIKQLPLPAEPIEPDQPDQPVGEPEIERIAIQANSIIPEEPEQKELEPELDNPCPVSSAIIGPNPLASSSRSLINNPRENLLLARADSSGKSGANSRIADNLAELVRHHIREPAKSRLARLEHVTPDLIRAHCEGKPPGQAIYRIEHNWPVPQVEGDEDDRKKYISGEYADFIEH
jgi:hypothetical protein